MRHGKLIEGGGRRSEGSGDETHFPRFPLQKAAQIRPPPARLTVAGAPFQLRRQRPRHRQQVRLQPPDRRQICQRERQPNAPLSLGRLDVAPHHQRADLVRADRPPVLLQRGDAPQSRVVPSDAGLQKFRGQEVVSIWTQSSCHLVHRHQAGVKADDVELDVGARAGGKLQPFGEAWGGGWEVEALIEVGVGVGGWELT
jgi:hypothetical protein